MMGKTSSLNWYIYRMCFDYLNKRVQERGEKGELSKAEREALDKLVDEIVGKLRELDIKKETLLREETRKYIEEARKKYPELIEE